MQYIFTHSLYIFAIFFFSFTRAIKPKQASATYFQAKYKATFYINHFNKCIYELLKHKPLIWT